MIDPAVKTATVLCVLTAGFCASMLFRRESTQPPPAPPAQPVPDAALNIRHATDPASIPESAANPKNRAAPADDPLFDPGDLDTPAMVVTPLDRRESPPQLAESYPEPSRVPSSSWGLSMNMLVPVTVAGNEAKRTHRIVDGDTLPALAERYLGSPARALEIFDANRSVLSKPELLPIGVELKIPARGSSSKHLPPPKLTTASPPGS